MPKLGVNIDHVATLRQARREDEPDPIEAARICEKAGADSIVCHLREDRRHIVDKDVRTLRKTVKTKLNLEMALSKEIIDIAASIKPDQVTLVPEKRQEITTEGGLDVFKNSRRITNALNTFNKKDITVSLFIDPVANQIKKTADLGVPMIELHTGKYALVKTRQAVARELKKLKDMTEYALSLGLIVNAGHGLKYDNTIPIAKIKGMEELNIGHSIISRAVFVGLERAVREMVKLCKVRK